MLITESQPSRIGSVIDGKYQLIRLLGFGGMSEVYEARHVRLHRRVALKLLLPHYATAPEVGARFLKEARAAGSLHHENVGVVYDVGEDDCGVQYLVMEYLQGCDCAEALRAAGTFTPARAVALAIQACRGLAEVHEHGIIHRDLKPANLFLTVRADGSELVKVLDFGIAKLRSVTAEDGLCTRMGLVLGTPYYMSPEQAMGDASLDLRTDIYSLGVVLFELLTGCRPFEGDTAPEVVRRVLMQDTPRVAAVRADVPRLSSVVEQAMARRREQRFESMQAFRMALMQCLSATPPTWCTLAPHTAAVDTPNVWRRASSRLKLGLLVAAALLGLAVLSGTLRRRAPARSFVSVVGRTLSAAGGEVQPAPTRARPAQIALGSGGERRGLGEPARGEPGKLGTLRQGGLACLEPAQLVSRTLADRASFSPGDDVEDPERGFLGREQRLASSPVAASKRAGPTRPPSLHGSSRSANGAASSARARARSRVEPRASHMTQPWVPVLDLAIDTDNPYE